MFEDVEVVADRTEDMRDEPSVLETPEEQPRAEPVSSPPPPPKKKKHDPLNTEFIYYSATLRNLAPSLTREIDRCHTIPWIEKLFGPEYQPEKFRKKRNKYLCSLTITLMNDEVTGVFQNPPPCGALYELEDLACEQFEPAEWEQDTLWEETIQGLPESFFKNICTIHQTGECDDETDWSREMLDEEFRLFLYLVRPYAALLPNTDDKTKVASWIQLLCSVPKSACTGMRSLRNDYMHALYGCLNDLCVMFPFTNYAPVPPLPLPITLAKGQAPRQPFTDPTSFDANEFLKTQPVPETGAFCYVAVSGELLDSSLPEDAPVLPDMTPGSSPKPPRFRSDNNGLRHVEVRSSHLETRAGFSSVPSQSQSQSQSQSRACNSRIPRQ